MHVLSHLCSLCDDSEKKFLSSFKHFNIHRRMIKGVWLALEQGLEPTIAASKEE